MKLVVLTLAALALLAAPAEVAPVGLAAADLCDLEDTKCHVRKLRECFVNPNDPFDPPVCTD